MTAVRGAPIGREVKMRMEHWDGPWPEPGDYFVSEAGSAYLIDQIRAARPGSKSTVFTSVCIKVREENARRAEAEDGARVHPIVWAKRRKSNRYPESRS